MQQLKFTFIMKTLKFRGLDAGVYMLTYLSFNRHTQWRLNSGEMAVVHTTL